MAVVAVVVVIVVIVFVICSCLRLAVFRGVGSVEAGPAANNTARERFYADTRPARRGNAALRQTGSTAAPVLLAERLTPRAEPGQRVRASVRPIVPAVRTSPDAPRHAAVEQSHAGAVVRGARRRVAKRPAANAPEMIRDPGGPAQRCGRPQETTSGRDRRRRRRFALGFEATARPGMIRVVGCAPAKRPGLRAWLIRQATHAHRNARRVGGSRLLPETPNGWRSRRR
jgi:hypothetical protein